MANLDCPEWALVRRITASRGFQKSKFLTNFLLFIAHRALSGRADTINEQEIGIHVFDREKQFNRGDDNIVRNYARTLRKRIDLYFVQEGKDEPLRLHVPRGGYVPIFAPRERAQVDSISQDDSALPLQPVAADAMPREPHSLSSPTPTTQRVLWLSLALLVTGALAGVGLDRLGTSNWLHHETAAEHLSRVLWKSVFARDRDTFIVPSDGGLVILHRFLQQPTTLSDYINGAYKNPNIIASGLRALTQTTAASEIPTLSHKVTTLGDRRYTSMVDLDLASRLARQRDVVPERLLIRYARDLRMDDLKTGDAILIGSVDSNPWVELFQPQLNFQFDDGGAFGGSSTILNRNPRAGEQATYASVAGDPRQRTYGVVAYVPNLNGTARVLIIEGINMAGTEAAGEFLLDPVRMQPVLQKATRPDGQLRSFEILLQTESIAANSSQAQVLSERVGS
jgi:hypothetical protein